MSYHAARVAILRRTKMPDSTVTKAVVRVDAVTETFIEAFGWWLWFMLH